MIKKASTKTQQIVIYLMDLIRSKKIPTNKIMPSEHALMLRFDCSRSAVVSAYHRLEALGAVYSISKRGHFVAENFHNLIKPISYILGSDEHKSTLNKNLDREWLQRMNIIFEDDSSYEKVYIKDGKVICYADCFVLKKYFDNDFNINDSLINQLVSRNGITNIVYHLKYEDVNKFGYEKLVVLYVFGYDFDSISFAAKYVIHPDNFDIKHQEFSLV
ncbi:GntR family transcriptional regulator [Mycoplasma crocodyli]|uniref:Transcriptional regulator, GntR family protein n=1 Tax=Mycoplasma crocodyli (strain ATCC 51981 / MP145) TaxID=512564 RepID=D5E6D5_MYCCM|nr:GntR family transcriptional regulator [Mycoplasma crocodyli]ADE19677.1 transcriptional regulator, GntR family protein [Mycoplasma crocodyli MP145]